MPEGHEEISWASGWQPLLFQSEVAVPSPPEATVHEDVDLGWGTLGGRDRKWLRPSGGCRFGKPTLAGMFGSGSNAPMD
jgi:hypothetical protein